MLLSRFDSHILRSGLSLHDIQPILSMKSLRWFLKSINADFITLRDLLTIYSIPILSDPNSAPNTIKLFSVAGSVRYVFCISSARISSTFKY